MGFKHRLRALFFQQRFSARCGPQRRGPERRRAVSANYAPIRLSVPRRYLDLPPAEAGLINLPANSRFPEAPVLRREAIKGIRLVRFGMDGCGNHVSNDGITA